ncbi:MAG TPA: nucleoside-diphosphate sugar epimerase/dehydratase [Allosphingosinicella sp.]|jgi:FlaA1/EpsC-like NDP-sugar epimerase|nr:nucleoside-diphosphate sugar epimerase/dehydratase [Allosphingosinicella sp.]
MIFQLVRRVSSADRAQKRLILVAYDVAAMMLALVAAFSARFGEPYLPLDPLVMLAAGLSMLIGLAGLFQLRIYHIVLRFFDLGTVSRILFGAAIAATAWVILVYLMRASMVVDGIRILVPRSIGFIYGGFLFVLLFMGRYAMAALVVGADRKHPTGRAGRRNIVIYGANSAGISLAESVRRDRHFRLCGFVDDDPALRGQIIAGAQIHPPAALAGLVDGNEVSEVFLAMPNATRSQRLSAIERLNKLNVQVMTVPSPEEIVSGRFTVSDVRPIDVNDLLRRDPVEPLSDLIQEAVDGQTILITGAGGSIGSEICRQIVRVRPAKLVLLDHSEFALYTIEQQLLELMKERDPRDRPEVVPVVGSMLNELLVRDIIRIHGVETIYHAAAYKHVPLLEHNEVVGVENNVLGTWVLARAAFDARLTRFTMISTDKAVRPESVMGASKRVAELVIQALAEEGETRFGIVRFGNVLDSSGSVVQTFREQIRRGGPVTVTHPEVTRFFMSIPEATQLVLQASAMARHGEVFVLDMGEPIRIAELARNMISLSGMTVQDEGNPAGDIEISYVGLRPGEKLYEELFVGEGALDTAHPRIKMAKERFISFAELRPHIDGLRAAIFAGDSAAVRDKLQELIAPDQGELGKPPAERPEGIPRDTRVVI